jgi:hypothetical protein
MAEVASPMMMSNSTMPIAAYILRCQLRDGRIDLFNCGVSFINSIVIFRLDLCRENKKPPLQGAGGFANK